MARRNDPAVARVWRERVKRQRNSGLSIAEFCRREEVSQASFYLWRKRLRQSNSAATNEPLFLPVEMPLVAASTEVEIELPGGAVVRLPADAELVRVAIQAASAAGQRQEDEPC